MKLKTLKFLLNLGNILALTPRYHCYRKTFSEKCRFNLMVLVITGILTVAGITVTSDFSTDLVSSILTVSIIICTYVWHMSMIFSVLYMKNYWMKLINFMKNSLKEEKDGWIQYLNYFIKMSIFWVIGIPCNYFEVKQNAWSHTLVNILLQLEWYCLHVFQLLVHIFLCFFIQKYQQIRDNLENQTNRLNLVVTNNLCLHREKHMFMQLYEIVNTFNRIFQWPFLFNTALTLIMTLTVAMFTFYSWIGNRGLEFLCTTSYGIMQTYWLIDNIMCCDGVLYEVEMILLSVNRLQQAMPMSQELNGFFKFVKKFQPQFLAGRFFVIRRSTILSLSYTIINFLIVAIQFKNSAITSACRLNSTEI